MSKWYVVSEEELERLTEAAFQSGRPCKSAEEHHALGEVYDKAEAACRARPVPDEATHFYWETEERNGLGVPVAQTEEIHK